MGLVLLKPVPKSNYESTRTFQKYQTPNPDPRTGFNPTLFRTIEKIRDELHIGIGRQQQQLFLQLNIVVGNLFEIHSTTKYSGEFQEFMKASDVQAICFQA